MPRFLRAALAVALIASAAVAAGLHPAVAQAGSTAGGLAVSVAYAEDKETNNPNAANFPVPWLGSPNVTFLGGPVVGQTQCGTLPSCFDAGAVRLDNPSGADISVSSVSVDIHSSISGGKVFNLWGSFTVPAGKSVILTENPPGDKATFDDFDTSSWPSNVCTPITVVPTVTITVAGVPTTLSDSTHVLDTGGIDLGFCGGPAGKNESIAWRPIGAAGSSSASLSLAPGAATKPVGGSTTETATLLDGGGVPVANVGVAFSVTSGPNAGQTGSGTTDAAGHTAFTYSDTAAGTDIVAASVTTVGTFSTQAIVSWGSGGPTWSGADIGSPPFAGSDSLAGGVWTISGSGRDIGGTTDQFHFVSQPIAGDGAISARVLTQTNTNSLARAGVMFRQSADAAAPFYAALVTPGSGIWVLERASAGGQVINVVNVPGTVPAFLRIDRTGGSATASTSPDGITWTPIAGSAHAFGVSGAVLAGLAVTSHSLTAASTATLDSLTLSSSGSTPTPTPKPTPTPAPSDFSMSASPSTLGVSAGHSGHITINTGIVSGAAESIALSASGMPAGVTAGFAPSSVTAGNSSTLTFTVGSGVAAGSYPITVTGIASSATHAIPVTLNVTTVPGAPSGIAAVAGNASAVVSWTAPGSDGGSAITAYTVTSSPASAGCATTGTTSCSATGLTNGTPYTFSVTAANIVGPGSASAPSASVIPHSGATYHAIDSLRILDTRTGIGGPSAPLDNHVARTFQVTGVGGVPSNATAVTGNLTVTGQTRNGYLFIGPVPDDNPTSSTLNFPLGDDRANAVTVALGDGVSAPLGSLSVTFVGSGPGTAQVIFDVTGFFTPDASGATYHAFYPSRILDTRNGTGGSSAPLSNHVARTFAVTGVGGVPSNATAVTGNLTVTGQTRNGYLFIGPVPDDNPTSSTLNFPLGDDRANAVTVALGDGVSGPAGSLSVTFVGSGPGTAQVIFDVTGFFTPDGSGATYIPLNPSRILDTRNGTGGLSLLSNHVAGTFGVGGGVVPANAVAVTGNLTVTGQTDNGFLYIGPAPTDNPASSNLNFPIGDDRANAVDVALGDGLVAPLGSLSITYVGSGPGTTQAIFDVTGYFMP